MAKDRFAPIQADDRVFGDPASGKQKTLMILCRCGTSRLTIECSQQEVAVIPPLPPAGMRLAGADKGFVIVAARYGAGLTWFDVTDGAANAITSPTKAFLCDGFGATKDPWFGVGKHVVIWFDHQGKRYVRVFKEGETHSLLP
jgi:hypothetical protein